MSCTHHCHLFSNTHLLLPRSHLKKFTACCTREMKMMNAFHCRHLFFRVNYYLHQGDNDDECMFIIIIFFLFLGPTSTKEMTTMNVDFHCLC
jgi:hypothetical protein